MFDGNEIGEQDDPAEDGEDDPAEDGDDAPADNDQKGGFDEVYQEVIKPLDADALPEGAGLLPPQETATGVSEADETLVAEEGKAIEAKEETASKKTGKAGKSVLEERAKVKSCVDLFKRLQSDVARTLHKFIVWRRLNFGTDSTRTIFVPTQTRN